jgi:hypothetical protein
MATMLHIITRICNELYKYPGIAGITPLEATATSMTPSTAGTAAYDSSQRFLRRRKITVAISF